MDELVKQCRDCIDSLCGDCKYEHLQKPGNFVPCMNALLGEAADAIEELSKPKWIPVTERLPGEFGRYLCRYRVEEGETIGYCTDFGRYDPEHGEWFVGTVTHWMPLPPAPKEEE